MIVIAILYLVASTQAFVYVPLYDDVLKNGTVYLENIPIPVTQHFIYPESPTWTVIIQKGGNAIYPTVSPIDRQFRQTDFIGSDLKYYDRSLNTIKRPVKQEAREAGRHIKLSLAKHNHKTKRKHHQHDGLFDVQNKLVDYSDCVQNKIGDCSDDEPHTIIDYSDEEPQTIIKYSDGKALRHDETGNKTKIHQRRTAKIGSRHKTHHFRKIDDHHHGKSKSTKKKRKAGPSGPIRKNVNRGLAGPSKKETVYGGYISTGGNGTAWKTKEHEIEPIWLSILRENAEKQAKWYVLA